MPRGLFEFIKGFGTAALRKDVRDRCYKRHAQGEAWEEIARTVMPLEGEESPLP
jgi:hypothetical protein